MLLCTRQHLCILHDRVAQTKCIFNNAAIPVPPEPRTLEGMHSMHCHILPCRTSAVIKACTMYTVAKHSRPCTACRAASFAAAERHVGENRFNCCLRHRVVTQPLYPGMHQADLLQWRQPVSGCACGILRKSTRDCSSLYNSLGVCLIRSSHSVVGSTKPVSDLQGPWEWATSHKLGKIQVSLMQKARLVVA